MKRKIIFSITLLIGFVFTLFSSQLYAQATSKAATEQQAIKKYTCPMHPEIQVDKPGKCPKCGMPLEIMETMSTYMCPMHPEMKSDKPGKCSKCGMALEKKEATKVYTCSMHPEMKSDKPGKCPKCGMELMVKK